MPDPASIRTKLDITGSAFTTAALAYEYDSAYTTAAVAWQYDSAYQLTKETRTDRPVDFPRAVCALLI